MTSSVDGGGARDFLPLPVCGIVLTDVDDNVASSVAGAPRGVDWLSSWCVVDVQLGCSQESG